MNCGACVWIVVRVQVEACVCSVGIQCPAPLLIEFRNARLAVVAVGLVVVVKATAGMAATSVLPEPVGWQDSTSRPFASSASTSRWPARSANGESLVQELGTALAPLDDPAAAHAHTVTLTALPTREAHAWL